MRIRMGLVINFIRKEESSNHIYLNMRQSRFNLILNELTDILFATSYL